MGWSSARSLVGFAGPVAGAILCLSTAAAVARAGDAVPLFADDALIKVRLEAPISTLTRQRSDTDYLDGLLKYTATDGSIQTLDVKLRARGRYRRKPDTCSFPPVRLNFRKGQVEGTPFHGVDKLKLVTHCKNSSGYEQNTLEEYLAYRILNGLTDYSFRARLLQIEYVDTEAGDDTDTRYAFLIEDDDLMQERLGLSRVEVPYTAYDRLEPVQSSLVSVFQYLIGNTDYSMIAGPKDDICCHNIVLFSDTGGAYIPIPYDFDFAGLVDARYAKPNPRLKIRKVTIRMYRGDCSHNGGVPDSVAKILADRQRVDGLIDTMPGMEDKTRAKVRRYLDVFYSDMADPRQVERRLLGKCN